MKKANSLGRRHVRAKKGGVGGIVRVPVIE